MYIPQKRLLLVSLLLSLTIVFSIVCNFTLSRYEVAQQAIFDAPLAKFEQERTTIPNNDSSIVIPLNEVYPTSKYTYNFQVRNFTTSGSNKVYSGIPFEYKLYAETFGNIPIKVTLQLTSTNTNTTGLYTTASAHTFDSSSPGFSFEYPPSSWQQMSVNAVTGMQYHQYTLTIEWPESSGNAVSYSYEVDYIKIYAKCVQVQPN